MAQSALIDDLKTQLRDAQQRVREREDYVLQEVRPGAFVYAFRPKQRAGKLRSRATTTSHRPTISCQVCFDDGKKSVLQRSPMAGCCTARSARRTTSSLPTSRSWAPRATGAAISTDSAGVVIQNLMHGGLSDGWAPCRGYACGSDTSKPEEGAHERKFLKQLLAELLDGQEQANAVLANAIGDVIGRPALPRRSSAG